MGSKYFNSYKYAAKYANIVTHSYHAAKNFTTARAAQFLLMIIKFIINSRPQNSLNE